MIINIPCKEYCQGQITHSFEEKRLLGLAQKDSFLQENQSIFHLRAVTEYETFSPFHPLQCRNQASG
jgi:hypothetical protein